MSGVGEAKAKQRIPLQQRQGRIRIPSMKTSMTKLTRRQRVLPQVTIQHGMSLMVEESILCRQGIDGNMMLSCIRIQKELSIVVHCAVSRYNRSTKSPRSLSVRTWNEA